LVRFRFGGAHGREKLFGLMPKPEETKRKTRPLRFLPADNQKTGALWVQTLASDDHYDVSPPPGLSRKKVKVGVEVSRHQDHCYLSVVPDYAIGRVV